MRGPVRECVCCARVARVRRRVVGVGGGAVRQRVTLFLSLPMPGLRARAVHYGSTQTAAWEV